MSLSDRFCYFSRVWQRPTNVHCAAVRGGEKARILELYGANTITPCTWHIRDFIEAIISPSLRKGQLPHLQQSPCGRIRTGTGFKRMSRCKAHLLQLNSLLTCPVPCLQVWRIHSVGSEEVDGVRYRIAQQSTLSMKCGRPTLLLPGRSYWEVCTEDNSLEELVSSHQSGHTLQSPTRRTQIKLGVAQN